MIVDFFVAGVQKGGTTAVDQYLRNHPAVQMASDKEVHFFDDETIDWTATDYARLHRAFNWRVSGVIRGEATPIYTYWPNAIHRIKKYNAEAKIIVGLRHPSFRAISHWRMEKNRGWETLPFASAIRQPGRQRVIDAPNQAHRVFSYIERGFYSLAIHKLFQSFPSGQVLFFRTDHLWSEHVDVMNRIQDFLKVDRAFQRNRSYIVKEMTWRADNSIQMQDRAYLAELFNDDIRKTEQLTGIPLDDWLEPNYCEPMQPD